MSFDAGQNEDGSSTTAGGLARPPDLHLRWWILVLLAIGVMISFVDRTSVSAALAVPAFKAHFGLSDLARGWVNSAFFWSYALLQVPLGWVVDRYGVKWPYAICFAVWCAATAAIGLVGSLAALIAMRLVVGAMEAIVVPASWRWIRTHYAEKESGTAVGIYILGTKIGPAIGTPIAAWLIVVADWRAMFFVVGLAGLVWLIPWLLMVSSDVPDRRGGVDPIRESPAPTALRLLTSPLVWGTLIVNFCYNYFTFFCMTWMPAYLVEQRGLSLERMGLYAFFSFAGIAVVAIAAGWAADRLIAAGRDPVVVRKTFTITGFAIASTVVLGAHATDVNTALFWNVASLSGLGLATANYLTLCRLTLVPASAVGVVTGLQQVATAIAGIVAPLTTGWLLHIGGDYSLPIDAIFVFLVIGGVTTAVLLSRRFSLRTVDAMQGTRAS